MSIKIVIQINKSRIKNKIKKIEKLVPLTTPGIKYKKE